MDTAGKKERWIGRIFLCLLFFGFLYTLYSYLTLPGELPQQGKTAFYARMEETLGEGLLVSSPYGRLLFYGRTEVQEENVYGMASYGKETDESKVDPLSGQTLLLSARLSCVSAPLNPGENNDKLLFARKQIAYYAYGEILHIEGEGTLFAQLRARLKERGERLFGPYAPVMNSLCFGVKDELDHEVQESFSRCGIAHVLVASGLHVRFLFAAFLLLSLFLSQRGLFYLLAPVLFLYAACADFSVSIVRAVLMCLFDFVGRRLGRRADGLISLSFAGCIQLVLCPTDACNPSFLLSYAAVLGIFCLFKPLHRKLRPLCRSRHLTDVLCFTLSAQFATLPFSLYLFSSLPLLTLPVNLILIPVLGCVIVAGIFIYALAFCLPLASLLAKPLILFWKFLLPMLDKISSLPFALLRVPGFLWLIFPLTLLLLLLYKKEILFFKPVQKKILRICASMLVLIGLIASGLYPLCPPKDFSLTLLDAGKTKVALVQKKYFHLLIDPTTQEGGNIAGKCIKRKMGSLAVLLTHFSPQNLLGLQAITNHVPIEALYYPSCLHMDADLALLLEQRGIPAYALEEGESYLLSSVFLTLLPKEADKMQSFLLYEDTLQKAALQEETQHPLFFSSPAMLGRDLPLCPDTGCMILCSPEKLTGQEKDLLSSYKPAFPLCLQSKEDSDFVLENLLIHGQKGAHTLYLMKDEWVCEPYDKGEMHELFRIF